MKINIVFDNPTKKYVDNIEQNKSLNISYSVNVLLAKLITKAFNKYRDVEVVIIENEFNDVKLLTNHLNTLNSELVIFLNQGEVINNNVSVIELQSNTLTEINLEIKKILKDEYGFNAKASKSSILDYASRVNKPYLCMNVNLYTENIFKKSNTYNESLIGKLADSTALGVANLFELELLNQISEEEIYYNIVTSGIQGKENAKKVAALLRANFEDLEVFFMSVKETEDHKKYIPTNLDVYIDDRVEKRVAEELAKLRS